ncbi:MAG: response regulator [Dehalococcoidia bacterium]
MAGNARILVIDQDLETRAEMEKGLNRAEMIVVGGAGYGAEALSLAAEVRPTVVLVGMEEPAARALQTIESLADLLPEAPILVYSSLDDAESARKAVVAGARDYLTKPCKIEEVVKAVRGALAQQERRRALISGAGSPNPTGAGMIITVFGAKGGIGKTTISTNLATALVDMNAGSAVIVDVDTIFGDTAMMLDVAVEQSLIEAVNRVDELSRQTIGDFLARHHSGVEVLPAPFEPIDWRHVNGEALEKVLTLLAQTHDFVIVDCPATLTDLVAVALDKATIVLLLTSLDITSVKDTTTALKLLQKGISKDEKIRLVVNHATGANSVTESDVSSVLHREIFWSIPHDAEIAASAQLGTPVVIDRPGSKVSQAVRGMAASLAGVEQHKNGYANGHRNGERTSTGLLTRLFGR